MTASTLAGAAIHFELIVVGAHDGSKLTHLIKRAGDAGNVMLIEPVPFLFDRLQATYGAQSNVLLRKLAIGFEDGHAEFAAPKPTAVSVAGWGDQIGSLRLAHAVEHDLRLRDHVETIRVKTVSFRSLIISEHIASINCLFVDTEGLDAELLQCFPFSLVVPREIIFEFKHSDGTFRVGRKLAYLLIMLEALGYQIRTISDENMKATLKPDAGLLREAYPPDSG